MKYLNQRVKVVIDRPLGSKHPKHDDIIYPINYGYIPDTIGGDGEEIDVYVVGEFQPLQEFEGIVIAVVIRGDDVEEKYIVCKNEDKYSKEQLYALVEFQERFFRSKILMNKD